MTAGHPDPLDPNVPRPDPASWGPRRQRAFRSEAMEAFREGLSFRGLPDTRSAVLDDLSTYFEIDAEEALYHATHSFEESAEEWNSHERREREELTDFFVQTRAMCFGLLWHSYLQAEGYSPPVAVMIADDLADQQPHRVLDFGTGPAAAAMMFRILGHEVAAADISTSLLKFARYRFERRGLDATFIDLNDEAVPENAYDTVAAIQVFVCVPNVTETATTLHRALSAGGNLFADFDVRPRTGTDARLYDDDRPLRRAVQRSGFEQEHSLEQVSIRYRKVEPRGPIHAIRGARDAVVFGPARTYWRRIRYR